MAPLFRRRHFSVGAIPLPSRCGVLHLTEAM